MTKRRERRRLRTLRGLRVGTNSNSNQKNYIVIPKVLDLEDNRIELIKTLKQIQNVMLNGKRFSLDHRKMESITKDALLVLTSEIERCKSIAGLKIKANRKLFPKNPKIISLLHKIGYWEYFNMPSEKVNTNNSKLYLKIVGDTKVNGQKIGELIQFFQKLICFNSNTKDKFSDALMEAAANTVEHAYSKEQDINTINKWWLTASLNKETNEVSFIFYDQGLGILNTLEATQRDIKWKRLIAGWINEGLAKGGILRKLVTTNLSSYKDETRGNGLISFKSFIEEVDNGELTIYTDNVSYSAISDEIKDYDDNLDGTLIVWKMNVNNDKSKGMYLKDE